MVSQHKSNRREMSSDTIASLIFVCYRTGESQSFVYYAAEKYFELPVLGTDERIIETENMSIFS